MQAKATKNREILDQIGIMLVEFQDVLRGVVHGMNVVSPVVIAALLRVAFEVRCNLQFILSLRELERLLSERIEAVGAYGPGSATCQDAEAHAFLARLRSLMAAAERPAA